MILLKVKIFGTTTITGCNISISDKWIQSSDYVNKSWYSQLYNYVPAVQEKKIDYQKGTFHDIYFIGQKY